MRRLCFGGSFNPIHHGHLICARAVAETAGFDRVVLIPAALPPDQLAQRRWHGRSTGWRCAGWRWKGTRGLRSTTLELSRLDRVTPSTPPVTLGVRDGTEVYWLIGADTVPLLPHWHESDALLTEVSFVVMARPGHDLDWKTLPGNLRALRQGREGLGSRSVRQTCAARRRGPVDPIPDPPRRWDYIRANGLYR